MSRSWRTGPCQEEGQGLLVVKLQLHIESSSNCIHKVDACGVALWPCAQSGAMLHGRYFACSHNRW